MSTTFTHWTPQCYWTPFDLEIPTQRFDGVDGKAQNLDMEFTEAEPYSFGVWFCVDDWLRATGGDQGPILAVSVNGTGFVQVNLLSTGKIQLVGASNILSTASYNDNDWHFVCVVVTSTLLAMHLDYTKYTVSKTGGSAFNSRFVVGSDGIIDTLLYSRINANRAFFSDQALTDVDVSNFRGDGYGGSLASLPAATSNKLTHAWEMDEGGFLAFSDSIGSKELARVGGITKIITP